MPELSSITDTKYFDVVESSRVSDVGGGIVDVNLGFMDPASDLAFVGYTYKRWETLKQEL